MPGATATSPDVVPGAVNYVVSLLLTLQAGRYIAVDLLSSNKRKTWN